MFLGIDLGGTKVEFAWSDGDSVQIIGREKTPTNYDDFLKLVSNVTSKYGVKKIGIGLPATYDDTSILWAPNIQWLEKRSLIADVQEKMDVEVQIANDAQMALLGESWKGACSDVTDAILISVGTGVGGAIMVDGKILKGKNGAAGAFGWMNLDYTHPVIKNHGYLEYYASGSAISRKASEVNPPLTSYELVEKARSGDEECTSVLHDFGRLLGVAIASVVSILDMERVVLSGGLSDAFDLYEEVLKNTCKEYCSPGIKNLQIVKSQLGNRSGVYGAVRLVMG